MLDISGSLVDLVIIFQQCLPKDIALFIWIVIVIGISTLLVLKTEYSGLEVNTMPADALAPKVISASASMVLAVAESNQDRIYVKRQV